MANNYKVVGQDNPGAVLTALYTVPASTQFTGTLLIANREAAANTVRVAISPAGAGIADDHYVLYDLIIPAHDALPWPIPGLEATDVVRVYASDANVSFTLSGVEITA
jgi:hypothetical protein